MKNTTQKNNKSSLRVAVILSGRITAYEHHRTLDNLCKKYKCTFFCSINKSKPNDYLNTFFQKFNIDNSRVIFEKTVYPEWLFKLERHPWTVSYENVYSSLYHNKRAFDMLEKYMNDTHENFDVVLRFRPDIVSKKIIHLVKPKMGMAYIPDGKNGGQPKGYLEKLGMTPKEYGICDIAFGDFNTMKVYCTLTDRLHDMCTKQNVIFHHERLLKRNLELNNIPIHLIKYDFEFHKRRHNASYNLA
jgi:hypothetical protein